MKTWFEVEDLGDGELEAYECDGEFRISRTLSDLHLAVFVAHTISALIKYQGIDVPSVSSDAFVSIYKDAAAINSALRRQLEALKKKIEKGA